MFFKYVVIISLVLLKVLQCQSQNINEVSGRLALPEPAHCVDRIRHEKWNGTWYFFSWEYAPIKDTKVTWFQARNICRKHCMDTVSIESDEENEFVKKRLIAGGVRYSWTSGRKCNFDGCDRPDLKPAIVNGWFWSGSGVRLGPTDNPLDGDWSKTGGDGEPQPDNREFKVTGKNDEACLAILNNFYGDGVVWHDIACHHKKYFICEDSPPLKQYVMARNPDLVL